MSKKHKKQNNSQKSGQETVNKNVVESPVELEESLDNNEETDASLVANTSNLDEGEETNQESLNNEEMVVEEGSCLVQDEEAKEEEPISLDSEEKKEDALEIKDGIENEEQDIVLEENKKSKKDKKKKKNKNKDEEVLENSEALDKKEAEVIENNESEAKEENNNISNSSDKYKVEKYLRSQNYFSFLELQELLIKEIEEDNVNIINLYETVSRYETSKKYNIFGLFYYYAMEKSIDLRSQLDSELSEYDLNTIYFNACKFAIKKKNEEIYKELTLLIKSNDLNSIYLDIIQVYHRNNVSTFSEDDRSYNQGVKLAKLLKSRKNKLNANEFNCLFLAVMESFGNPYNEDIKKGTKIFNSYSENVNEEICSYALILLGVNYILHYEYDKAEKLFKTIGDKYWFEVGKNRLLIKNKVRTFEDLKVSKPYKDSEEYKNLENKSLSTNDPAVIERFNEFANGLDNIKDLRKGRLYENIRKSVYVLSFVIYTLSFLVNHYIKTIGLMIINILCALAIMGITLLYPNIFKNFKKHLVKVIVFGSIGLVLILLAIIL